MGIKDLYQLLDEHSPESSFQRNFKDLCGWMIAVDVSIFLNKYVKSAGPQYWLSSFIGLLCTLKKHGIQPIFIFDGDHMPPEKTAERLRRRAEAEKCKNVIACAKQILVTLKTHIDDNRILRDKGLKQRELDQKLKDDINDFLKSKDVEEDLIPEDDEEVMIIATPSKRKTRSLDFTNLWDIYEQIQLKINKKEVQNAPILPEYSLQAKELITMMGFPWFQAYGEAETLCANLVIYNYVDAVLSEDTDCLAYGARIFISKIDPQTDNVRITCLEGVLEELNMKMNEFRDLCIMLKCDYNSRTKLLPDPNKKPYKVKGILKYPQPKPVGVKTAYELITTYRTIENIEPLLYNPEILNYRRCRDIFTPSRKELDKISIPYNRPIDVEKISEFLKKYDLAFDLDYVKSCWKEPKLNVK